MKLRRKLAASVRFRPTFRAILIGAVVLCSLLMGDAGWGGEITGVMTSDGWWMRPGDATYEEWTFTGLDPATLKDPFTVKIKIYVTNQVNGGSGYSTEVKVTVVNPDTAANQVFSQVWLQNDITDPQKDVDFTQSPVFLSGTDPDYSYGYGYPAEGSISVPAHLISADGTMKVRIERLPNYQVQDAFGVWNPHVGDSYNQRGVTVEPGPVPPPPNRAPIANAGPDQSVLLIPPATTVQVTLDGSDSFDPDDDPLTYTWTWDSATASGVNPTIPLKSGTHTITLTVSDGSLTDTDTVIIRVVSHRPTAKILYITPSSRRFHKDDSDTTITFKGSASDDKGHPIVSYKWRLGDWGVLDTTALFQMKPSEFPQETHKIYFSATCQVEATSTEVVDEITISDLPKLTIESVTIGWLQGDRAAFNARALIEVRIDNAQVTLDEVILTLDEESWIPTHVQHTEPDDINPGRSWFYTFYIPFEWDWCPDRCDTNFDDLDTNPRKYWFKVTADIEDEHGHELEDLTDWGVGTFSIPYSKKRDYIGAYYEYWIGIGATISVLAAWGQPVALKLSEKLCKWAKDPWVADPAYQQEIFATVPFVDPGPISKGDIGTYEKTWNASEDCLSLSASLEALHTVIPKMLGAAEAYDDTWLRIHCADALRFGVWAAEDFEKTAHSTNELRKLFTNITVEDIQAFQNELSTSGFPEQELLLLQQLGSTQEEINDLLDKVVASDPEAGVKELQIDRENQLKAFAAVYRGMAASVWPGERFAIAITSPRKGGWVRGQVEIEVVGWTNQHLPPVVEGLSLDGFTMPLPPFSWNTTGVADGVADGIHTLIVIARDAFGQPIHDMISVTVDNTPPVITVTSPLSRTYPSLGDPIPLTYSVGDNLDDSPRVSCVLLNGVPLATDSIPRQPGSYQLVIKAVDAAGNYTEESVSFHIGP